jgi:antitoxin ParD1/3/4
LHFGRFLSNPTQVWHRSFANPHGKAEKKQPQILPLPLRCAQGQGQDDNRCTQWKSEMRLSAALMSILDIHSGLLYSGASFGLASRSRRESVDQMNVSITDRLAEYVRGRVKSGRFNNASEVVREALRRMELDDERASRLAAPTVEDVVTNLTALQAETVRKRVLEGIGQMERGEFIEVKGRTGLAELTAGIKARGRRRLQEAASK